MDTWGLHIIDAASGRNAAIMKSIPMPGQTSSLHIQEDKLFVLSGQEYPEAGIKPGLKVLDISSPLDPILVGQIRTVVGSAGLTVQGDYAYLPYSSTLIDVVDVAKQERVGSITASGIDGRIASNQDTIFAIGIGGLYTFAPQCD